MTGFRWVLLTVAHGALAAWLAAMAETWISVTSGRTSPLALLTPSGVFPGLVSAAAVAGAVLGPILHRLIRRSTTSLSRPAVGAALIGVAYAIAVMQLTFVLWIPWTAIAGRGPAESIVTAVANAAFTVVFGTPLLLVTAILITAPVVLFGGTVIGLAVRAIERSR